MKTKDEILGAGFYPEQCGSAIQCVTRKDALAAMDEHLSQHIQSEITFLEGLLPNVNDPAIEARIESLKKQLIV